MARLLVGFSLLTVEWLLGGMINRGSMRHSAPPLLGSSFCTLALIPFEQPLRAGLFFAAACSHFCFAHTLDTSLIKCLTPSEDS